MMWKIKRKEIYSCSTQKRAQIFNKTIDNIIPTGVPSHWTFNFLLSMQKGRTATIITYYEEMKPLFIILRMFGIMAYHVTSEGKSRLVKFIRFDK
jgi:hypothetical protein